MSAAFDRDFHLVIRTLGRPTAASVIREALEREQRLTAISVVSQACSPVVTPTMRDAAAALGVTINEKNFDERLGIARARVAGAEGVEAKWIAFLDDDIVFESGSLTELIRHCEDHQLGGACGVVTNDPDNSRGYRYVKSLLFRGIFRDPRQQAVYLSKPVRSPVMSGGLVVFRTNLVRPCLARIASIQGYGNGEDFELSYCVSRQSALEVVPEVRVRNLNRSVDSTNGPEEVAQTRLSRYRRFARRNARTRADWVSYLGVVLGVGLAALRDRASLRFLIVVTKEAGFAVTQCLHPDSPDAHA